MSRLEKRELQPERQEQLLDLAVERALRRQEQVLGDLLGDARAALHRFARARVLQQCAPRAQRVDAEMLEEAPVLGGQRRLDHVVGDVLERDGIVVQDAALADLAAVAVEELDRILAGVERLVLVDLQERRQRQRIHEHKAAGTERQRLRAQFIRHPFPAAQAEAGKEARGRVIALLQPLPGRGETRIDPRIDAHPVDELVAPLLEEPVAHASLSSRCAAARRSVTSGHDTPLPPWVSASNPRDREIVVIYHPGTPKREQNHHPVTHRLGWQGERAPQVPYREARMHAFACPGFRRAFTNAAVASVIQVESGHDPRAHH